MMSLPFYCSVMGSCISLPAFSTFAQYPITSFPIIHNPQYFPLGQVSWPEEDQTPDFKGFLDASQNSRLAVKLEPPK